MKSGICVIDSGANQWRLLLARGERLARRQEVRVVRDVSLLTLNAVDARVLRAADPSRVRTAERVAGLACCSEDPAGRSLRQLRGRMLVEVDGSRPTGWLRTVMVTWHWSMRREGGAMLWPG
jgi:hypothetical protein